MKKPKDYKGPALEVVLRDPSIDMKELFQQYLDKAFVKGTKVSGPVGTFA